VKWACNTISHNPMSDACAKYNCEGSSGSAAEDMNDHEAEPEVDIILRQMWMV